MTQEEIDALINGGSLDGSEESTSPASAATASAPSPGLDGIQPIDNAKFPDLDFMDNSSLVSPLDPKLVILYDLQLPVSIELGRTNMLIRDILRLGRGSVIEFDKLVSEPVDVLINGKKVAEGEVVVIDKHFGIRITTLIDPADRLRSVKK